VKNDLGNVVVDGVEIRSAWREHYNCLLNVEFDWERNGLASAEPIQGPLPLTDHDADKRTIGKMKNIKAAGSSGIVGENLGVRGGSTTITC